MRSLPLFAALLLSISRASAASDPRFDGQKADKLSTPALAAPEAPAAPQTSPDEQRLWVVLAAADSRTRTAAATAGVSIEEVRPGRIAGFSTPAALARAKAAGLKVLSSEPLSKRFSAKDFPAKDAAYHNFAETVAELKAIVGKAPDIASLFSIGKTSPGRDGHDIWALRLCPDAKGPAASKKPGIAFMGMHHAREHLSNEVPLLLARRLVENRRDPEVARLLAGRDVYIIPMVNPDGGEYDVSGDRYHMQRKNMRQNGDGSVGVDLNRNYGWGWGGEGASPYPADDTYRGPDAFSEPETQAVKAFVESKKNLTTLLSYHTFSELVLYPWGGSSEPIADKNALKAYRVMAEEMGRMTGYTPMQSSDLYVATGDLTDWSWGEHGIFSWTFELTPKSMWEGGFYPGAAAIATTVQANWRPLLYLIDLADNPRRAAN
ncbi:MAG: M14 family metallopeptidase [Elusimicrobiota bacterium]|mgnify:CR=1 FL=1